MHTPQIRKKLRTALFSRLGPGTSLGTHSGWEDLANHVLRIHIPLILPSHRFESGQSLQGYSQRHFSFCGAWVEGEIKHHLEREIIVFDDSKCHRAFNYSDKDERLILILDMVRPSMTEFGIPLGTAVGGHTGELNEFLKKVT